MKENQTPMIRNCARAVIIRDGALLLLCKQSPAYGTRYALPGGAQDEGETLQDALLRECQEEIGVTVAVGNLLHVAEYFKPKSTIPNSKRHTVDFLFACSVADDYVPTNGPAPDKNQKDVLWLPLNKLATVPFYPSDMLTVLDASSQSRPLYLGLIS